MTLKQADQDLLLQTILQNVPFDGWGAANLIDHAAEMAGLDVQAAKALYPNGVLDIVAAWGLYLDRAMMENLQKSLKAEKRTIQDLKIRERIEYLVWARLQALLPYKETVNITLYFLAKPPYCIKAPQFLWQGANTIWYEAGDTATDYNHYTKRGLLSAVMMSTLLYWLRDDSDNHEKSRVFLQKRIADVLRIGQAMGTAKDKIGQALQGFTEMFLSGKTR